MHGLDLASIFASVDTAGAADGRGGRERLLRRAVDSALRGAGLQHASERAFVGDNLNCDVSGGELSWHCNVDVLREKEHHVHDFPAHYDELTPYLDDSALFIGGTGSSRLTEPAYLDEVRRWFPSHELSVIPKAEHFLHRTHAAEVIRLILGFSTRLQFE